MEKKDLISVRDYTFDDEYDDLGYYQPKYVSARDYVNDLASKLRGKKEKVSSFMTVAQFANELRNSQYSEEELAAKERIEAYMENSSNIENNKKAVN